MLEYLLVLGQVPGTNFEITFFEVVLATYLPMLLLIWAKRDKLSRMDWQYFKLMTMRRHANRELRRLGIKPAELTHRRETILLARTFRRPILPLERPIHRAF